MRTRGEEVGRTSEEGDKSWIKGDSTTVFPSLNRTKNNNNNTEADYLSCCEMCCVGSKEKGKNSRKKRDLPTTDLTSSTLNSRVNQILKRGLPLFLLRN